MTEKPSLPLALFDFVPVILFAAGGWCLACTARALLGGRWPHALLLGAFLAVLGGAAKAVSKLASAAGLSGMASIGDVHFALQAPGFVLLFIAALAMLRGSGSKAPPPVVAAIAPWKLPLLVTMALFGAGTHAVLAVIAWRRHLRLAAACFGAALIFLLAMGASASGVQTIARQWLEQSINSAGQLSFLLGSLFLYRQVTGSWIPSLRLS